MSLYNEAASVLTQFLNKQGGLKTLAFNEKVANKKGVYALVVETLKFKEVLDEIVDFALKKTIKEEKLPRNLILIMVYDLLIGNGNIQGGGRVKKQVLAHQNALKTQLARVCIKKGVSSVKDLKGESKQDDFPRYARVNAALSSVEQIREQLNGSAFTFVLDAHVPNLLVFPSGTDLHAHPLVEGGQLILQDKASCFSALALNPQAGWHVMDACSAPGNKTSHLVAILHSSSSASDLSSSDAPPKGKVTAFEIDNKRCVLLQKMLTKAGVLGSKNPALPTMTVRNASFLDADPRDTVYLDVRGVLVDPTCSGSGMQRIESQVSPQQSPAELAAKLEGLAKFQTSLVLHAMTFPNVERVVYSTCSIYPEENEGVVSQVLSSSPSFILAAPKTLESWSRRGWSAPKTSLSLEQSQMVIRTDPQEDKTNGFFVACFERNSMSSVEPQPAVGIKKKRKKPKKKTSKRQKVATEVATFRQISLNT